MPVEIIRLVGTVISIIRWHLERTEKCLERKAMVYCLFNRHFALAGWLNWLEHHPINQ